jgi:hypothetical protein
MFDFWFLSFFLRNSEPNEQKTSVDFARAENQTNLTGENRPERLLCDEVLDETFDFAATAENLPL